MHFLAVPLIHQDSVTLGLRRFEQSALESSIPVLLLFLGLSQTVCQKLGFAMRALSVTAAFGTCRRWRFR
jgi:hypothetical protein